MGFLGDLYRDLYSRIRERETDEEELNQIRLTDFFSFIFIFVLPRGKVRLDSVFYLGLRRRGASASAPPFYPEKREERREERREKSAREERRAREKSAREKIRSKRRRETTERRLAQQL